MTSGPPDGDVPPDENPGTGGWGQPPGQSPGQPPGQAWQPSPQRRHPLVVVGGLLIGLFLGFFGLPYTSIVLVSEFEPSGVGPGFLGFAAPILIGIALLVPKKLRTVGAGILMGLSIGMIVGSAACLGLIGLFIASYSSGY
jgi:hypothetical protein